MPEPPAKKLKMASATTSTTPSPSIISIFSSSRTSYSPDVAVTLLVGYGEHKMLVHSHYITECSEFFKAALKSQWQQEGKPLTVKLPEEHSTVVALYLDFVYRRVLPSSQVTTAFLQQNSVKASFMDDAYAWLIDIYLLGDRMIDGRIQNAVIEELIRLASLKVDKAANQFPSAHCVRKIYQGTLSGSPLRRLLVDMHVSYGSSSWLDESDYDPTYVNDLAKAFIAKAEDKQTPTKFRMQAPKAQNYTV